MQKNFLYLLGHLKMKNQRHKNPCQRGTNYFSKNSVQLGQNFQNHTSVQSGQKLKVRLLHRLGRSWIYIKRDSDQLFAVDRCLILYFSVSSLSKDIFDSCFYGCFNFRRIHNRNVVQVTNIKRNSGTFLRSLEIKQHSGSLNML